MEPIQKIIKYLKRNAWIQAMDIVSLYRTAPEERYSCNWSAILQSPESSKSSSIACFVPFNSNHEKKHYSRDLEYSRIGRLDRCNNLTVYIERTPPEYKFKEEYRRQFKDFVIVAYGYNTELESPYFEPNCKYEILEKYKCFNLDIAKDAENHEQEYNHNYKKLFEITVFPDDLPIDEKTQIELCSDKTIPVLTIQGPPGTGKTSFLSDLIVHLITKKGVSPGDIHCLTYTRRACIEIRQKIYEQIKANRLPPTVIPDLNGKEDKWEIDKCVNKIFCESIFKNPPTDDYKYDKARKYKRPIVLIDEASQISIPYLLYAMRYGTNDAVIRLFGDQRQLDPVCAYVRNYKTLGDERDIRSTLGEDFIRKFEGKIRAAMADIGPMFKVDSIKKTQMLNMRSEWGRSYFSISDFLDKMESTSSIPAMLKGIHLVRTTNYRQEKPLHDRTHKLSYSNITRHHCAHDLLSANVAELVNRNDKTYMSHNIVSVLFKDAKLAHNLWNKLSGYLDKLVGVNKRFLGYIFSGEQSVIFTQQDYENALAPRPFELMDEKTFTCLVKNFFMNNKISNAVKELGAEIETVDIIANKLWERAKEHVVVISHNFKQNHKTNENLWEVILVCLFIYLWEHEQIRVNAGIGVVTPYRDQEVRIRNLYLSAFPDSKLREKKSWCATPERFQGRDLSRCVFSTVSENDQIYLEPTTMFSRNKLNVATSRAAHQQVVIAHKDLLSSIKLKEYMDKTDLVKDEEDKQVIKQYPAEYRQGLVDYCSGDKIELNHM